MRLFFATDIHGSAVCWQKFLNAGRFYQADVLVLGGDITGSGLVPIVELRPGHWQATLLQQEYELHGESEVVEMERRVAGHGLYAFRTTPDRLAELNADEQQLATLFRERMLEALQDWMKLADERLRGSKLRCFVCPGNDDEAGVDEIIRQAELVQLSEGYACELGEGWTMLSTGWSNITPRNTYREASESELASRIDAMMPPDIEMRYTVFNFHCPPYGSGLDNAPDRDGQPDIVADGQAMVPVGSTAVRDAIMRYQPMLSLHGHIHAAKGITRLGRTLAINAGSLYEQGVLQGAFVDLDTRKGIKSYALTTG